MGMVAAAAELWSREGGGQLDPGCMAVCGKHRAWYQLLLTSYGWCPFGNRGYKLRTVGALPAIGHTSVLAPGRRPLPEGAAPCGLVTQVEACRQLVA